jgi:hypothetical protein
MHVRVWKRLLLIAGLAVLPACGGEATEHPEAPGVIEGGQDEGPGRFYETPDAIPGQYIVVLKTPAGSATDVPEVARALTAQYGGTVFRTYEHALQGFAMYAREDQARAMATHRAVSYVAEDGLASADGTPRPPSDIRNDRQ